MAASSKRGLPATKTRSSEAKGSKATAKKERATSRNAPPAPRIKGEKAIRRTSATLAAKPLNVTREAQRPIDPRAVDRRKQVFDDPSTTSADD